MSEEKSGRKLCAVVGNSNSILHHSYAEILSGRPELEVHNYSIGGSPCALLLDFLARVDRIDFDYIIIETSVIDYDMIFSQRLVEEEVRRTLTTFFEIVSKYLKAKVLLLVLPIRIGIMRPDGRCLDRIYLDLADAYDANILDGYALFDFIARGKWHTASDDLLKDAGALLENVGITPALAQAYIFQPALLARRGVPPFARNLFIDDIHPNYAYHEVIAELVTRWMLGAAPDRANMAEHIYFDDRSALVLQAVTKHKVVHRSSRLITRDFTIIEEQSCAIYEAEAGYRLVSILFNSASTCGILHVKGSAGSVLLDLRLGTGSRDYTAAVVPVFEDVGDGPFHIEIQSGHGKGPAGRRFWHVEPERLEAHAELAYISVVKRDFVDRAVTTECQNTRQPGLLTWIDDNIQSLIRKFDTATMAVEAGYAVSDRRLLERAIAQISSDCHPLVSQARLLTALGDLNGAQVSLKRALALFPEDQAIQELINGIQHFQSKWLS